MRKRAVDLLDLYLSEIHVEKFLTAEEEARLSGIIQAHKPLPESKQRSPTHDNARNELVRRNLPLVVSIAREVRKKSVMFTTVALIQIGNSALIRAAELFDQAKHKTRFTTYATECIEKQMMGAIAKAASSPKMISLNEPSDSESDTPRIDRQKDHKAVSPHHDLERGTIKEVIGEALDELDPDEREVISLAFGLKDYIYHTPKEISRRTKIIISRVHSLKASALKKLMRHKKLKMLRTEVRR